MKAFSASIFTEQTQASLKRDAYRLSVQDPIAIKSILECEDDSIVLEMEARRAYYQSLLEAQYNGIGIVKEAGGIKLTAAIIAGIIAIITAVIALITGGGKGGSSGGSSSSTSYSTPDAKAIGRQLYDYDSKSTNAVRNSDTYKKFDKLLSDLDDKGKTKPAAATPAAIPAPKPAAAPTPAAPAPKMTMNKLDDTGADSSDNVKLDDSVSKPGSYNLFNPILYKAKNDVITSPKDVRVREFEIVARNMPNIEVIDVNLPDKDICSGNFKMVTALSSAVSMLDSIMNSIISAGFSKAVADDGDLEKQLEEQFGSQFQEVDKQMRDVNDSEDAIMKELGKFDDSLKSKISINPYDYLSKKFECFDYNSVKPGRSGHVSIMGTVFKDPTALKQLRENLKRVLERANKIEYNQNNEAEVEAIKNLNEMLIGIRRECIGLSKAISSLANCYRNGERMIASITNRVSQDVINYITVNYNSLGLEKSRNDEARKQYDRFEKRINAAKAAKKVQQTPNESYFIPDSGMSVFSEASEEDIIVSAMLENGLTPVKFNDDILTEAINESQQVLDEIAGVGIIAAAIAGIVILIKKAIDFIKDGGPSKSSSSSSSSSKPSIPASSTGNPSEKSGSNDSTHINITDRCDNPYIPGSPTANSKIKGMKFEDFNKLAESTSVEVTKYKYPSLDLLTMNIPETSKMEELFSKIISITAIAKAGDAQKISSEIDALKAISEEISEGLSKYDSSVPVESSTMMAREYLTMDRPWLEGYDAKDNSYDFNPVYVKGATKRLDQISDKTQKALQAVKDTNFGANLSEENSKKFSDAMQNSVRIASAAFSKLAIALYSNFWKAVNNDIMQMNRVTVKVALIGSKKESAIDREMIYVMENAFDRNDIEMQSIMIEFYQLVDDNASRLSIYVHQNQMRVMNEEALIFSETSLSDYEKFEKLQAVQEALGDKIKKGYYNAIAALKEIFRKFMEKLTANFGTTKAYLDRYKNIILKSQFANNQYKTQNLSLGIRRIIDTPCPAMDFNKLMTKEANEVNSFFTQFVKPNLKELNMTMDKLPEEGSGLQGINEFFKTYFCMQGHDATISGPDFQKGIKEYYDFLYDIRKINQTIKKSLDEIDRTAANVMKQAGVNVTNPTTPAESVVYSHLYQKYFTLNEYGTLVEAEKINSDTTDTQETPGNRIQNIDAKGDSNDTNAIKNNPRGTIDTKVKVYVDVCSSMLKAKMSACEFIRNECMQIIRDHVKSYVGGSGVPQEQQPQQGQQQGRRNQNDEAQRNARAQAYSAAKNPKGDYRNKGRRIF